MSPFKVGAGVFCISAKAFFCMGLLVLYSVLLTLPAEAADGRNTGSDISPQADPSGNVGAFPAAKARALGLLEAKDYEAAYQVYMALLREHPESDEINYGLAYAALGVRQFPHALLAFERLSDRYPGDATLHLRLAETHIRLGDAVSARHELKLARQCDPAVSGESVEQAVRALELSHSPWLWNGKVGLGVIYDSNANLGPASEYMSLGQWADLCIEGVKGVGSWGRYVNAFAGGLRRLGMDGSPWSLVGDVGFYKRWNGNPALLTNREFAWGRLAVGGRYLSRRVMVDLRIKGDESDQGQGQRAATLGPEASVVWAPHPQTQFITRAAWEHRNYRRDRAHNGQYWWAAQYLRLLTPNARYSVTLGGRILRGCPTSVNYGYTGWEGSLVLGVRLPHRLELDTSVSFRRDIYTGPATALESERRSDAFLRYGVSLRYAITPHLQAEFSWQAGRAASTSALYRYTQRTFNTGLAWVF